MVYRKGQLTPKRALWDWPHHYLTVQPPNGFSSQMNRMHEFARRFDHVLVSAYRPGTRDATWWCFKSLADADAFRAWYEKDCGDE